MYLLIFANLLFLNMTGVRTPRRVLTTTFVVESITDSECVFAALAIQYVMRMRRIVICVVYGPTVIFHIISAKADFRNKYY